MPVNFYRRIPRVVRALRFILTDSFEAELREFCSEAKLYGDIEAPRVRIFSRGINYLAMPGDWLVQWAPGDYLVFAGDSFPSDFEPFPASAEVIPRSERDVKATHDQELASREVIVPHPPAQIEYQHVPIGQWFFVDIPECRDRYNVVERTESGCIAVCSSPWHHDKSKADLIEIVRLHNHATVDPIATKKWVPPMTVHTLHGVKYQACNVGGSTWMVKKLICGNDFENQANYVEALISVDTTDEMTAIQAAFARGSWA